jgi:hypothetical protein
MKSAAAADRSQPPIPRVGITGCFAPESARHPDPNALPDERRVSAWLLFDTRWRELQRTVEAVAAAAPVAAGAPF